ncbi:unnamed protein product [Closterium sp. Naga37s-1]|nr:unnamed protein product [Closterium sp. Naga37s-1]
MVRQVSEYTRMLAEASRKLSMCAQSTRIEAAKLKKVARLQQAAEVRRLGEMRLAAAAEARRQEEERRRESMRAAAEWQAERLAAQQRAAEAAASLSTSAAPAEAGAGRNGALVQGMESVGAAQGRADLQGVGAASVDAVQAAPEATAATAASPLTSSPTNAAAGQAAAVAYLEVAGAPPTEASTPTAPPGVVVAAAAAAAAAAASSAAPARAVDGAAQASEGAIRVPQAQESDAEGDSGSEWSTEAVQASEGEEEEEDTSVVTETTQCSIDHPGALSCLTTTIRKDDRNRQAVVTLEATVQCAGDACLTSAPSLGADDYAALAIATIADAATQMRREQRLQPGGEAGDPAASERRKRIEELLAKGHVVKARPVEPPSRFGHESFLVRLRSPDTKEEIDAMFKPRVEGDAEGWHRAPIEWVAYELNLLLGMDYIPPVAYRTGGVELTLSRSSDHSNSQHHHHEQHQQQQEQHTVRYEEGAFIYWVPHTKELRKVAAASWGVSVAHLLSDTRILDVLLNNSDRHHGHFLFGQHWTDGTMRPVLIDHAAGFRREAVVLMEHENAFQTGSIRCVSAHTYLRLRFLDRSILALKFSGMLSEQEITDLITRRDQHTDWTHTPLFGMAFEPGFCLLPLARLPCPAHVFAGTEVSGPSGEGEGLPAHCRGLAFCRGHNQGGREEESRGMISVDDKYSETQQQPAIEIDDTLKCISHLPPCFRSLFSFRYFNAVQSEAFGEVYTTDNNIVVSAPTVTGDTDTTVKDLHNADIILTTPESCIRHGVAFHNGGLDQKNRTLVESLFLRGDLQIICTTATLAVGVNLPAHLVVIKSTQIYNKEKGGYVEYDRASILQMSGRAGRPQFDKTGKVVIMTRRETVYLYENLMSGSQPVESELLNLETFASPYNITVSTSFTGPGATLVASVVHQDFVGIDIHTRFEIGPPVQDGNVHRTPAAEAARAPELKERLQVRTPAVEAEGKSGELQQAHIPEERDDQDFEPPSFSLLEEEEIRPPSSLGSVTGGHFEQTSDSGNGMLEESKEWSNNIWSSTTEEGEKQQLVGGNKPKRKPSKFSENEDEMFKSVSRKVQKLSAASKGPLTAPHCPSSSGACTPVPRGWPASRPAPFPRGSMSSLLSARSAGSRSTFINGGSRDSQTLGHQETRRESAFSSQPGTVASWASEANHGGDGPQWGSVQRRNLFAGLCASQEKQVVSSPVIHGNSNNPEGTSPLKESPMANCMNSLFEDLLDHPPTAVPTEETRIAGRTLQAESQPILFKPDLKRFVREFVKRPLTSRNEVLRKISHFERSSDSYVIPVQNQHKEEAQDDACNGSLFSFL